MCFTVDRFVCLVWYVSVWVWVGGLFYVSGVVCMCVYACMCGVMGVRMGVHVCEVCMFLSTWGGICTCR